MSSPARVLVCGTVYGSSYVRALSGAYGGGPRIVGILGRGGPSSRGHAQQLRVAYYTSADEVPAGAVEAVCVAVGGEAGLELARSFLARGLPVISEHPMRAEAVAALQATAAESGAVWHLNSHFGDLPCVQPWISGCHRLVASGPPLFLSATTNPRTLFSLIDILRRALGPFGEPSWQAQPWVDEERDFLVTATGRMAGTSAQISCQRTVSAEDDGSATVVGHHLEVAYPQGVLELADTFGPVLWRPNPSREPQESALWSTWPAGPPPTLQTLQAQRDSANHAAVESLLAQARGAPPPAHQRPDHQLEVATTWDALVAAIGPPVLIQPGDPLG